MAQGLRSAPGPRSAAVPGRSSPWRSTDGLLAIRRGRGGDGSRRTAWTREQRSAGAPADPGHSTRWAAAELYGNRHASRKAVTVGSAHTRLQRISNGMR
jgi:hypothetical protein